MTQYWNEKGIELHGTHYRLDRRLTWWMLTPHGWELCTDQQANALDAHTRRTP